MNLPFLPTAIVPPKRISNLTDRSALINGQPFDRKTEVIHLTVNIQQCIME